MATFLSVLLAAVIIGAASVQASDPELTTDFFVPPGQNVSAINGSFFTFTGFEGGVSPAPTQGQFGVTKAFSNVFPALTGLGVSFALLDFGPLGLNPPHTHPRGTELLYVITGSLVVGLIDSTNTVYSQTLQTGDVYVFPKGLVHFQVNTDTSVSATAISSFSSSSPGLISLPANLFASSIPIDILTQAFSVSQEVIQELEAPFSG